MHNLAHNHYHLLFLPPLLPLFLSLPFTFILPLSLHIYIYIYYTFSFSLFHIYILYFLFLSFSLSPFHLLPFSRLSLSLIYIAWHGFVKSLSTDLSRAWGGCKRKFLNALEKIGKGHYGFWGLTLGEEINTHAKQGWQKVAESPRMFLAF